MIDYLGKETKSNGQTMTIPAGCTMVVVIGHVYTGIGSWWKIGGVPITYSLATGDGGKLTGYLSKPLLPDGSQVFTTDGTTTYTFLYFRNTMIVRSLLAIKFGKSSGSIDYEVPTNPADILVGWSNGGTPPYDVEDSTSFTNITGVSVGCVGYKKPSAQAETNTETIRFYGDGSTVQGGYISLIENQSGGDSAMQNTAEGICI